MRFIIASAILLTLLQSCKKYPEGPLVSLHSRETRVEGNWVCEKVLVNNQESTPFYAQYIYGYGLDNSFTEYNGNVTIKGSWQLTSDDDSLIVTFNTNQILHRFKILKLKNKSIWLIENRNTSSYEWHLNSK